MNTVPILILLFSHLITFCRSGTNVSTENNRNKKVFSIFTIVSFPNEQCTTKSDSTMYGTCYERSECTSKGGIVDGNCAAGFGVCCMFIKDTCASTVTQNCTYIQNPSYPTTYSTAGDCSYSVTPLSTSICQLRLDFDNFDLTETTAAIGGCLDLFTMTGPTGRNPDTLCGTLTGSHVYVEQGRSDTSTTLSININAAGGGTWKIKVTQIECSHPNKAPTDCNQYFTGISNTFTSYNWPVHQLGSKSFSYCFRREAGYCGIQYNAYSQTAPDTFAVDNMPATITATNGLTAIDAATTDGFLIIPGGPGPNDIYSGGIFCEDTASLCGSAAAIDVGGAVYRAGHNFVLYAYTSDAAQIANSGFKLQYTMLPCAGILGPLGSPRDKSVET